jgi:hypothetical protein
MKLIQPNSTTFQALPNAASIGMAMISSTTIITIITTP